MKFYYAPMSCAFATHVLLEDAGAQYSAVRIDLKKGDQNKPEFLKINPKWSNTGVGKKKLATPKEQTEKQCTN